MSMDLNLNLLTEWLLTYALHSTVLLGAAAIADRTILRGRSFWQELVWKAALLGGILSASLQLATGGSALLKLPVPDMLLPAVVAERTIDSQRAMPAPQATPLPRVGVLEVGGKKITAASLAPKPVEPAMLPAAAPSAPWIGLWLIGAALMLARLELAAFQLRHLLRGRRPFPNALLPENVPGWVRVSACRGISQPMAVGLREICLPQSMTAMPQQQVHAALAHELAHLQRGDGVWRWLCLLVQSVLFFQPLNVLASRRIAAAAEQGSDALALRGGAKRSDLVEVLAAFALSTKRAAGRSPSRRSMDTPLLASAMAGRRHEVVTRIENLLAGRLSVGPNGRLVLPVAVVVALAGALSLPTLSTGTERRGTSVEVTSHSNSTTQISVTHSDDDFRLKLKAEGRFAFNEAETALESLDGFFDLTTSRPGEKRRVRFVGDDGAIETTYWVDGRKRPYDAEAQAWFADQLPEMLRITGIDAEARAGRIYRAGGIDALLDEVRLTRSDLTRRRYLSGLAKSETLADDEVTRLLSIAGESIGSDVEQRLAMEALAKYQAEQIDWLTYYAATNAIGSDVEQRLALESSLRLLPEKPELSEAYVRATRELGSDVEHRLALEALLERGALDRAVHDTLIDAAGDIGSDLEQRLLLSELIKKELQRETAVMLVRKASEQIGSDLELRLLLSDVLDRHDSDAVKDAVSRAAEQMGGLEKELLLREL
ncbi:MAG: M56 family metallopeptidase [Pseudomonadota bacterium]